MPRSLLFVDLAGTLILRDPTSRQWVAWTGVAGLLHDLSQEHDLHLTTGDSEQGAHGALEDLEVSDLFRGVHAGLPGGGKPFGTLARDLGVDPAHCLAMGDSAVSDTAGDSDQVVSLIMRHERAQVPVARVKQVLAALASPRGYLAGFAAQVDDMTNTVTSTETLPASDLGEDCRLGWWGKTPTQRRPLVLLTA